MTITEKWQKMLDSFADIKAAIEEKGVSVGGYSDYARGVHSICASSSYTPKYTYPEGLADKLNFCKNVKSEIRQEILAGGLSCSYVTPLSDYGDIIRQLSRFEFLKTSFIAHCNVPCSISVPVAGGVPPYTFSVTGLPSGLTMSSDGIITGTATKSAAYFRVFIYCTDSTGRQISAKTKISVM